MRSSDTLEPVVNGGGGNDARGGMCPVNWNKIYARGQYFLFGWFMRMIA
jgi:hypothetical protein